MKSPVGIRNRKIARIKSLEIIAFRNKKSIGKD